jgi:hypothetical protein
VGVASAQSRKRIFAFERLDIAAFTLRDVEKARSFMAQPVRGCQLNAKHV